MAWIRDRALTLALMAMFLLFLAGQLLTGLAEYNSERLQHGLASSASDRGRQRGHTLLFLSALSAPLPPVRTAPRKIMCRSPSANSPPVRNLPGDVCARLVGRDMTTLRAAATWRNRSLLEKSRERVELVRRNVLIARLSDFAGPDQQQWNVAFVPNGGNSTSMNQIAEQAMTVRRHRDQVTMFVFGSLQNLVGWIA